MTFGYAERLDDGSERADSPWEAGDQCLPGNLRCTNKKALTVGEDSQGLEPPVTRKLYLKQQSGKIGEKTSLLYLMTPCSWRSSIGVPLFSNLQLHQH